MKQNQKLNNLNKDMKAKNALHQEQREQNQATINALGKKLKAQNNKKQPVKERVRFRIPTPFFRKDRKAKRPIIFKDQSTTIISPR